MKADCPKQPDVTLLSAGHCHGNDVLAGSESHLQTGQANGNAGQSSNHADNARDQDGTKALPNVADCWRPFLESIVAKPVHEAFPQLNRAKIQELCSRGRERHGKDTPRTSSLTAHNDKARRLLRNHITNLNALLINWDVEYLRMKDAHNLSKICRQADVEAVQDLMNWWLTQDTRGRVLLKQAAIARGHWLEYSNRLGVAPTLLLDSIWAPFPGCAPNRVRLSKRRRLHERSRKNIQLQDLETTMERDAQKLGRSASILCQLQVKLVHGILKVNPNFFAFEKTADVDIDLAKVEKECCFKVQLAIRSRIQQMLGRRCDSEGHADIVVVGSGHVSQAMPGVFVQEEIWARSNVTTEPQPLIDLT